MARWGVGALNIDGCRVGERWPANVMHDGSAEVIAAFPQTKSGRGYAPYALGRESRPVGTVMTSYGDAGSAARFFYSPKVSRSERGGTGHPTVKPVAVMRWLCRLIAPPGAVILDPFAGSGTTGLAARAEGQRAILVEREAAYCGDILQRLARAA
jgi:site-specific DNA-methyltransferase (adenine-specific)